MPGFTTHYLFGLQAYKQLYSPALKKIIKDNPAAYSLGLQGPDLFFYFLPSYTIRRHNIGSIAHTECTHKFLRHLLDSRGLFRGKQPLAHPQASWGKDLQIAEAYIAGFLGHYILDTQCHPYVYWKTGFRMKKSNRYYSSHMSLETDIDQELLMRERHCLPSDFRQDATIALTKRQAHVIAEILSYVYGKTYPRLGVLHITMHAAIRSIQLGTRFFHDPSGRKKRIAAGLEKALLGHPMLSTMIPSDTTAVHDDPLNLKRREWKNPWNMALVSHATFPELMAQAQERYLEVLTGLEKLYCAAGLQIPNVSPAAGLQISDANAEGMHKYIGSAAGQRLTGLQEKSLTETFCQKQLLKLLGNKSYHSGLDAGIPS